jgi:NADH-quinone oxidoreductase subunit C
MWDGYPYFPLRKEFPLAGLDRRCPMPRSRPRPRPGHRRADGMGGPFVAAPASQ